MVFRPDRRRRGHDPHLEIKVVLFGIAAVFALVGMYFGERWMTGIAIGVLSLAMLVRFLPGGADAPADDDGDDREAGGTGSPGEGSTGD